MLNTNEIIQTVEMLDQQHLDIRTITMGISLLDCADADIHACAEKIYRKTSGGRYSPAAKARLSTC